jgi:hypothetical protein
MQQSPSWKELCFFLEERMVPRLLRNVPSFNGIRSFITAFTTAHHLCLSWIRSIQSTPSVRFSEDIFQYYPSIYIYVFEVASFLQVYPLKYFKLLFYSQFFIFLYTKTLFSLTEFILFKNRHNLIKNVISQFGFHYVAKHRRMFQVYRQ